MNMVFRATRCDMVANYYGHLEVEVDLVDADDVLRNFNVADVVDNFDTDMLLHEIGIDEIKKYLEQQENNDVQS